MAKSTVKKRGGKGYREKTLKESMRDSRKRQGAIKRRVSKALKKIWG